MVGSTRTPECTQASTCSLCVRVRVGASGDFLSPLCVTVPAFEDASNRQ